MSGILVGSAFAQQRTAFVFHVYVDPIYGDNLLATQFNPSNTARPSNVPLLAGSIRISMRRASDGSRASCNTRHTPFRTLTTPAGSGIVFGAIDWIEQTIGALPRNGAGPTGYTIDHVIVHRLPGLYGPRSSQPIDPQSGSAFNGEQFPIVIARHRVSLQGTSALDTIFDARGQSTHILELRQDVQSLTNHDFVDGITFRNAATRSAPPFTPGSGAAIWIRGTRVPEMMIPVSTAITNCFFQGNAVGIAIDATAVVEPMLGLWANHRIRVFNNTFAWNVIGVWQGNTGDTVPAPSVLSSVFANNIFDVGSPNGFPAGASAFEGIDTFQREVTMHGTNPVSRLDFNAFPDERTGAGVPVWFNNGATIGPWQTAWPTFNTLETPARVDLTVFAQQPRVLFIADALRLGGSGVTSEHDLRLCPNVSTAIDRTTPSPTAFNPCIDRGIDADPNLRPGFGWGTIVFGNVTSVLLEDLGLPPGSEEVPITGWDVDAEGFGNPRSVPDSDLPYPQDQRGFVDLGADECDDLIVAGFVPGTRLFTLTPVAPIRDHTRIFFFGEIGTVAPRPVFNSIVGGVATLGMIFDWYPHATNPDPSEATLGNFTDTLAWGAALQQPPLRADQINAGIPPRRHIPRNLRCDFSPHLITDFHPLWGNPLFDDLWLWTSKYGDGYACNPWYVNDPQDMNVPPQPQPDRTPNMLLDNQCLFFNRNQLPHTTYFASTTNQLPDFTFVASGHMNPPGSFLQATPDSTWLVQALGVGAFGPFGTCALPDLYFGPFCYNDLPSGCPDSVIDIPNEHGLGRRFNLEMNVLDGVHRNLQTFLWIFPNLPPDDDPGDEGIPGDAALEMSGRSG
ncbi:MAG: hypothetical protein IPM29_04385 [Planctomycetes bacterium]|nr:hypothetical protein [Planctomycetota bacterium]